MENKQCKSHKANHQITKNIKPKSVCHVYGYLVNQTGTAISQFWPITLNKTDISTFYRRIPMAVKFYKLKFHFTNVKCKISIAENITRKTSYN